MQKSRTIYVMLSLVILLVLFLCLDIIFGSVKIPIREFIQILGGNSEHRSWEYIIYQIRMPRALTALMAGAGLSTAGLMMQTLFRNPLAGPYVLGISSGASLGVAVFIMATAIIPATNFFFAYSSWGQVSAAVLGALFIFLLIVAVAGRVRDSVSLLIVGIMFGSMTTALVSILQFFSKPEQVQKFVIWTMGSLSSTSWVQIMVLTPFLLTGLLLSIYLIKPMNALLLGENNAMTAGVPVRRVRYLILIATSLIAGALAAFTGPIAFIGLAVPHLTRLLFRSTNHQVILPGSILFGAVLLLLCDIISQVPGNNLVLPINAITALFGAPVVVWIIIGRKKLKTGF